VQHCLVGSEMCIRDRVGPTGPTGPTGAASTVPGPTGPTGPTGSTGVVVQPGTPATTDVLWLDTDEPSATMLPTGGTAGQVLSKINGTDYNTQWNNPTTVSVTSPITNTGTSTSATIGINQTALSQFGYRKFVSGYNYYIPNVALGTANPTVTRQWFVPLMVPETTTFTRLGLYIITGVASSLFRLGIYASDTNDRPSTLIVDGGQVSGATTASSMFLTINTTLTAGLYWLSSCSQGAAGSGPRGYAFSANTNAFTPANTSASLSASGGTWYQDGISGSFSNTSSLAVLATANVPAVTIGL
jgi:hypothetical protein